MGDLQTHGGWKTKPGNDGGFGSFLELKNKTQPQGQDKGYDATFTIL